MSRIGRQPILLPDDVQVAIEDQQVTVKGPRGELTYAAHPDITVIAQDGQLVCEVGRESKKAAALWGTTRARLANAVTGVHEGFSRKLELHGVGYRAKLVGKDLELTVGYSHPVLIAAPDGITFAVEKEVITVEGFDNVLVGQIAAAVRSVRKPEPYKGKGIRYQGEHVRRKVGKVMGTTE